VLFKLKLESYNTVGISITQGVLHEGCLVAQHLFGRRSAWSNQNR